MSNDITILNSVNRDFGFIERNARRLTMDDGHRTTGAERAAASDMQPPETCDQYAASVSDSERLG